MVDPHDKRQAQVDAAQRRYREAHGAEILAYQREYYRANRDAIIARKRAYRQKTGRTSGTVIWNAAQSEAASVDPAMSYDEIAEALGISKARVGQIMERALRKLRLAHPDLEVFLR